MNQEPIITTARNGTGALSREAKQLASQWGLRYEPRQDLAIEAYLQSHPYVFVYTKQGMTVQTKDGTHAFHLSMAELRIQNLKKGQVDYYLKALGDKRPLRILDCTFGFGSDAITAAYYLGETSHITALESTLSMYLVGKWGCQHFIHGDKNVTNALRRIHLVHTSYEEYIKEIEKGEYDILYFDPMFTHPVQTSPQFQPVRTLLNHNPLDKDVLELAIEKAKNRVIVKGRAFRNWEKAYPEMKLYGGRYSKVQYAVWEKEP